MMTDGVTGADELLRRADIALYQAKKAHSGYQLYERNRDARTTSGLTLLREVHAALHEGQFVLHYQPKAAAKSGHILGAEALARWEHPVHGLLGPASFIPLIEQSGLARDFTCFVIEQALRQAQEWRQAGRWMPVAVNLTVRNVHDSRFPDDVAMALERAGGDAGLLQLEITEGIMMADPARVLAVLEALAEQGIKLSLDDYGTGYSSLSYLGQLPLDELKIDKSFVMGMATEKHHVAIVRSTIELAHNLGLHCVAEGVEDVRTWDQLRSLGCDVIQGYFLSKPRPGAELSPWLAKASPDRTPPAPTLPHRRDRHPRLTTWQPRDRAESARSARDAAVGKAMTSRMASASGQEHGQAVQPDAEAGGGRQAVLEGPQVVLVDGHGLVVAGRLGPGLVLEAGPLLVGVDQLAEGVAQLPAGHDGLESLDQPGPGPMVTGQRRNLLGVVGHEHRPPQLGLGRLLVDLEDELARTPALLDPDVAVPSQLGQALHRVAQVQLEPGVLGHQLEQAWPAATAGPGRAGGRRR